MPIVMASAKEAANKRSIFLDFLAIKETRLRVILKFLGSPQSSCHQIDDCVPALLSIESISALSRCTDLVVQALFNCRVDSFR